MGTSHFCVSAALRQKIGPAMQRPGSDRTGTREPKGGGLLGSCYRGRKQSKPSYSTSWIPIKLSWAWHVGVRFSGLPGQGSQEEGLKHKVS